MMTNKLPFMFLVLLLTACNLAEESDKKEVSAESLIPEWGLGPFIRDETAPRIYPKKESAFFCPIKKDTIPWEDKSILCASAVVKDGKVFLIYRAEDKSRGDSWGTSRLGIAVSSDGRNFERDPHPVLYPDNDFMKELEWPGGCQDPRIVKSDSGDYIMTYTAFDGNSGRLCIAVSKDLYHWEKKGSAFLRFKGGKYKDIWSKSGAIVCRREGDQIIASRVNGKYWMYFGDTGLLLAQSDDLVNWDIIETEGGFQPKVVLPLRPGKWDADVVEGGPYALITDKGIHMIFNGGTLAGRKDIGLKGPVWSLGQVLFDKNDPEKALDRTDKDFFYPEKDWEINYVGKSGEGGLGNVVFVEGLIWFNNEWRFYSGDANTCISTSYYRKD